MSKITLLLFFSIILSACSGMSASNSTPEPPGTPLSTPTGPSKADCSPPSNWTIEYHRTGGIAGFDQSLTLQSDGSLTIKNKQPPMEKQTTIPEDHLKPIADLLVQACPFEVNKTGGNCADCFIYELEIQMDGKSYTVQAQDTNLSEELRSLTSTLDEFLQLAGQ